MTHQDICPACRAAQCRRVAGPSNEALERYHAFSDIKYGGFISEWPGRVRLEILRCSRCGHHWYPQPPAPEELAGMYAAGRRLNEAERKKEPTQAMIARMRWLKRFAPGNVLLDYGSGRGLWAAAAARAGFTVTAFEPHENRLLAPAALVEHISNRSELAGRTFDLILLEQVLEHVPNPEDMLRDIRGLSIAGRTVLDVRVPNIERECPGGSCWATWPYDGVRVHPMAPFEHLHGFTRRSLLAVVKRSGFAPLLYSTMVLKAPATAARYAVGVCIPRIAPTEVFARLPG